MHQAFLEEGGASEGGVHMGKTKAGETACPACRQAGRHRPPRSSYRRRSAPYRGTPRTCPAKPWRSRKATFERSEILGRAPSYAKDVTRSGCAVTGRVARPLRRAGACRGERRSREHRSRSGAHEAEDGGRGVDASATAGLMRVTERRGGWRGRCRRRQAPDMPAGGQSPKRPSASMAWITVP